LQTQIIFTSVTPKTRPLQNFRCILSPPTPRYLSTVDLVQLTPMPYNIFNIGNATCTYLALYHCRIDHWFQDHLIFLYYCPVQVIESRLCIIKARQRILCDCRQKIDISICPNNNNTHNRYCSAWWSTKINTQNCHRKRIHSDIEYGYSYNLTQIIPYPSDKYDFLFEHNIIIDQY